MMSEPLVFEGYSDDTFGEYGRTGDDHDDCANGTLRAFEVKAPDGSGMVVTGQFCPPDQRGPIDTWVIGVALLQTGPTTDEYHPMPAWPMRWSQSERGYSPRLEIAAPDDVAVRLILPAVTS